MKKSPLPKGWDARRVGAVLAHYEGQSDEQAMVEDEAAWELRDQTFVEVPNEVLPAVRQLLREKSGRQPVQAAAAP